MCDGTGFVIATSPAGVVQTLFATIVQMTSSPGTTFAAGTRRVAALPRVVDVGFLNLGDGLELDAAALGGLRERGGTGARACGEQRDVQSNQSVRHGCLLFG